MGIRFDRDAKRATNGPIIFFSDVMSESAFSEEVRGAIISGLSFYSYRMPGDIMISFGSSEGFVEGIGTPGFVIARFLPDSQYITIPYKGTSKNSQSRDKYVMPLFSTSFDEYTREVNAITRILKENPSKKKVVAARVIVEEENPDPAHLFFKLAKNLPDAFVFCFSTPATGCWIGASPELLLERKGDMLKTMSLAGTRIQGLDSEWDQKNVEEQQMVTEYLAAIFESENLRAHISDPFTREAGHIEHICTAVCAKGVTSDLNLENLLHKLSPTPALCGSPREFALDMISRYEDFDRGCYGGFCGPFHSHEDFCFNVVVRCASLSERKLCVYVGGGITAKSEVEKEWEETLEKSKTILDA